MCGVEERCTPGTHELGKGNCGKLWCSSEGAHSVLVVEHTCGESVDKPLGHCGHICCACIEHGVTHTA